MCSRLPIKPPPFPPNLLKSPVKPPANKVTETHKARARDALLSVSLLMARKPS